MKAVALLLVTSTIGVAALPESKVTVPLDRTTLPEALKADRVPIVAAKLLMFTLAALVNLASAPAALGTTPVDQLAISSQMALFVPCQTDWARAGVDMRTKTAESRR